MPFTTLTLLAIVRDEMWINMTDYIKFSDLRDGEKRTSVEDNRNVIQNWSFTREIWITT